MKNPKLAINMFFSFYGERLQYYTGIRIEQRFYKSEDNKGKPIDRSEVNRLISDSAPYVYKKDLASTGNFNPLILSGKLSGKAITFKAETPGLFSLLHEAHDFLIKVSLPNCTRDCFFP